MKRETKRAESGEGMYLQCLTDAFGEQVMCNQILDFDGCYKSVMRYSEAVQKMQLSLSFAIKLLNQKYVKEKQIGEGEIRRQMEQYENRAREAVRLEEVNDLIEEYDMFRKCVLDVMMST